LLVAVVVAVVEIVLAWHLAAAVAAAKC